MEALGLATSILILAETAKGLYTLLNDVRDAPAAIIEITSDLCLLQGILDSISHDQIHATIQSSPVARTLDDCTAKLKRLLGLLDGLGLSSTSKRQRTWAAIMFRLKKDKTTEYYDSLNSAKVSLGLAMQLACCQTERRNATQLMSTLNRLESSHSDMTNNINTVISGQSRLIDIEAHLIEVRHATSQLSQNMASSCGTFSNPFTTAGANGVESMINKAVENALFSPENYRVLKSIPSDAGSSYSHTLHPIESGRRLRPFLSQDDGVDAVEYNESCLSLRQQGDLEQPALQNNQKPKFRKRTLGRHDTTHKSLFGTLDHCTRVVRIFSVDNKNSQSVEQYEFETSFTVIPARWLFSYGVRVSMVKATRNIQHSIQYFPLVPESAAIFDFCKEGNTDAVRTLFKRRMASPFDTSRDGWTPLHFAASHGHEELCSFLLEMNAPTHVFVNTKDFWNWRGQTFTPLMLACDQPKARRNSKAARSFVGVAQILLEKGQADPLLENNIGVNVLNQPFCAFGSAQATDSTLWVLKHEAQLSPIHEKSSRGMSPFLSAVYVCNLSLMHLLLSLGSDIDERYQRLWSHDFGPSESYPAILRAGQSAMHVCSFFGLHAYRESIKVLVQLGADVHAIDAAGHMPTTITLSDPRKFYSWRANLMETEDFDPEDFLAKEVEVLSPEIGWTTHS